MNRIGKKTASGLIKFALRLNVCVQCGNVTYLFGVESEPQVNSNRPRV